MWVPDKKDPTKGSWDYQPYPVNKSEKGLFKEEVSGVWEYAKSLVSSVMGNNKDKTFAKFLDTVAYADALINKRPAPLALRYEPYWLGLRGLTPPVEITIRIIGWYTSVYVKVWQEAKIEEAYCIDTPERMPARQALAYLQDQHPRYVLSPETMLAVRNMGYLLKNSLGDELLWRWRVSEHEMGEKARDYMVQLHYIGGLR